MTRQKTRVLGTFSLAMLTMAAIVSLRNLSLIAGLGVSAVFFLCLAALIFFIPTALVVAELAAAWPRPGGCYEWVQEAFGKPLAFFTLWLSWMASVAWFPTILVFTSAMFAQVLQPVFPQLEHSQSFILICMLGMFWGSTFINFLGIEFSGFISTCGVILGTIIPGILIIGLGMWWVFSAKHSYIPLTVEQLVPNCTFDNLSLFAGVLLSLAGIELAAYHVREAQHPQRSYPRAILIAAAVILILYIFGTLAIAIVVPQSELSLATGLIQAFGVFLAQMNLAWLIPLMACCLFLGAAACINTWVAGPAKGMLVVAEHGFFPPWLRKVNKRGVPTALLILQAAVGSVMSILYICGSSNTFIWLLTSLSAQFTCLMYILIFCAALRLRYSQKHTARPFKVRAIWVVSVVGILACSFSFLIVYIPHSQFMLMQHDLFYKVLLFSFILLLLPPVMLIKYRHRSAKAAK